MTTKTILHVRWTACLGNVNQSHIVRLVQTTNEPRHDKPAFCISENKDADQLRGTAKLISAFVFATRIVHSLSFLNPKFPASSHLLWLYSPVCVNLVGIPEDRFSYNEAQIIYRHNENSHQPGWMSCLIRVDHVRSLAGLMFLATHSED